jgi:hypothetical protein
MKRRIAIFSILAAGTAIPLGLMGCGQGSPDPVATMSSAEKEQRIESIRKEPSIPAETKEKMIKSLQGSSQ